MGIINKIKHLVKSILIKMKMINAPLYTKEHFKGTKFIAGDYTYGKPQIVFPDSGANLKIGKFCSISNNVMIFLGGNHRVDWITTYPFNILNQSFPNGKSIIGHPMTKGDVIIGNDVWIGFGVSIMSGVVIETGAAIGAYSVVTKNVGPYEIWAGNPAKFIRKRFSEDQIKKLLETKWWDWSNDEINNKICFLCSNKIEEI